MSPFAGAVLAQERTADTWSITAGSKQNEQRLAEIIQFTGMKSGDTVAILMPDGNEVIDIVCHVVGKAGHVYAVTIPTTTTKPSPRSTSSSSSSSSPSSISATASCRNVTSLVLQGFNQPAPELHSSSDDPGWVYEYWSFRPAAENFSTPQPLDLLWVASRYHDLHTDTLDSPNLLVVNRAWLASLKPHGVLIIEDNIAAPAADAHDATTLHRIDPALVRKEVVDAGFTFVSESPLRRNRRDTHTLNAEEMSGKADRFLFKFSKP